MNHTSSMWATPYANHCIPKAIIWLAEAAERKATGRTKVQLWAESCAMAPAFFRSTYFKVIEEWGKWREEQDRIEYEKGRA